MPDFLTTSKLARAIGVSESSLKRWADEGKLRTGRTAGGHRRIPLNEAVRFIRQVGATVVCPELLGLADGVVQAQAGARGGEPAERVHHALEAGDAASTRALFQALYLRGWSVPAICDGPIRTSMERIGELWQHAEWGIFVEHRATEICIEALATLRPLIAPADRDGPMAIGSGGPGDAYMIPSLMASLCLWEAGYRDINLGPDIPVSVLMSAVKHYRPRLVWLSMSSVPRLEDVLRKLPELAVQSRAVGATLIVGGRALGAVNRASLAGLIVGDSMGELVAHADRIRRRQ